MPSRSIPVVTNGRIFFFLMAEYIPLCIYIYTYLYIYIHIYMCVCIYVYICVYIYIHTHIPHLLYPFIPWQTLVWISFWQWPWISFWRWPFSKFPGTWYDFLIYICNASFVSEKICVHTHLYLFKYYLYVSVRIISVILYSSGTLILNMLDLFNLSIFKFYPYPVNSLCVCISIYICLFFS